ncbi:hypothetical protein Pint_21429 [Pistacia integerrima]|uniref:Uncharacterized protein n=1 Tax=Pistacia integerrima TaxID=434235 RepID=A0ACC0XBT9_9ROSI|nr:hypothetical protein Pint_21429 [Pistacia integerrima]
MRVLREIQHQSCQKNGRWGGYKMDISDSLRIWQPRWRKRKAIFLCEEETTASRATSMKISSEETSAVIPKDIGDSESVCSGG